MPKAAKIALAVVAVFVVLSFAKNLLIQAAICGGISTAAHVPVSIGSTNVSLLKSSIRLKDMKVKNPRGFKEPLMLHAGLILIDFDPPALMKGQAHFEDVRLDLKEVVVVKNAAGKVNVDVVKPTETEKKQAETQKQEKKKGKAPKLLIDKLVLSIGKVRYVDYSGGKTTPSVQEFDINIKDRVYTNIDNPGQIVSLLLFEALTRTTIGRLAGLDVSIFKDGAMGALSGGLGIVGEGATTFEETAKGIASLFQ